MTIRDMVSNTSVTPTLLPAARVTGTATGLAVDLRGYDAAMISVAFGAYTDGTHTPALHHSADGTAYTVVAASDLQGSFTAVNSVAGGGTVQSVGYIGPARYVRIVMTVSGATSGALSAASVVCGRPRHTVG